MNKHSFFSHARRTALSACKLILFIAAFLSTMSFAQEQTPVDLRLSSKAIPPPPTITLGQDFQFGIRVFIERERQASGVIVTVELPEGITPLSVNTNTAQCSYTDNLITCNLGVVGREGVIYKDSAADMTINVRPTSLGTKTLTTRITANEPDPNLSNNTMTTTVTVVKSRKRVRFF
jgi:hypothetical protein